MSKQITTPMILDAMPSDKVLHSVQFVRGNLDKRGGVMGMGVDAETFHAFVKNPSHFIPILYLLDREAYTSTKERLENE